MAPARITELLIGEFKSYRNASLPLGGTTLLIGRNSSGKSNALDGLEVLARLAEGDDLVDALDGRRREGGAVRGGSHGCAPHGLNYFRLGCEVESDGALFQYEVKIEVVPELRIVQERLWGPGVAVKSGAITPGVIYESRPAGEPGMGIDVEVHNGQRGPNSISKFRDNRLILTQVPLAVGGANRAEKSVLAAVDAVVGALRGVFHFDPVPHLMRSYVQERDVELRRTGQNLSAALRNLERTDKDAFEVIAELVRSVADESITGLGFVGTDLDDLMLALQESRGAGPVEVTPAREMSDGLLRLIGIATALLSTQNGLDIDVVVPSVQGAGIVENKNGVLVVLEELENGLHPSQADRILALVRESSKGAETSVLATTHSPSLLDAAEGKLNEHIIVCHRDATTGYSKLTPIVKLPGYARALAEGSLGAALAAGKLSGGGPEDEADYSEFRRLLGIA
ncbi:AAA family ATPase [Curtobacterium sp. PhB172]|uniref:AAA family ATPase n=1 Tax=Curtobacterium sp. PhB172 TaxID=2485196 RepID=UPI000F4B8106|nr:ATP-binding protein [Curtobacterium sp. PhB172]